MGTTGSKADKGLNSSSSTTAKNSNNEKHKNGKKHVRIKDQLHNWNINEKTNANMNYNNALKNSRRSIHVN